MAGDGDFFRLLLVSDIHCAHEKVEELHKWLQAHAADVGVIDCIVASGDIGVMEPNDNDDPVAVEKCEEDVLKVLQGLEVVRTCASPGAEAALPIYWIPGNHDCHTFFSDTSCRVTENSVNIHGREVPLTDGLVVRGLGGSVPGYQDGKERWRGYPYLSQEDMAGPVHDMLPLDDAGTEQILLVTHIGPHGSDTTVDQVTLTEPPIYTGSTAMAEILRRDSLQRRVVADVHGHTHRASGMARIGAVPVINPGALLFGQFALLTLARREGRWAVAELRAMLL